MERVGGERRVVIIAGPNGAGKTTFAREFLPNEADLPTFINADLIAAGLNPFRPEDSAFRAGRLMLEMIDYYAEHGESFAFETTLSGRMYADRIRDWQRRDYFVTLFFLSLSTPELAIARVKQRVCEGGHSIPEDVIRRRYEAGLQNFSQIYKDLVDEWLHFDNSGAQPVIIDIGQR